MDSSDRCLGRSVLFTGCVVVCAFFSVLPGECRRDSLCLPPRLAGLAAARHGRVDSTGWAQTRRCPPRHQCSPQCRGFWRRHPPRWFQPARRAAWSWMAIAPLAGIPIWTIPPKAGILRSIWAGASPLAASSSSSIPKGRLQRFLTCCFPPANTPLTRSITPSLGPLFTDSASDSRRTPATRSPMNSTSPSTRRSSTCAWTCSPLNRTPDSSKSRSKRWATIWLWGCSNAAAISKSS